MDGAEALDYLLHRGRHTNATAPDLILLDLNLPKLDGRQVPAEMKKSAKLRSIPVVILTSSTAEKDILQTYRLGANCYLPKLVDLTAFQSLVRSVGGFWFTIAKFP